MTARIEVPPLDAMPIIQKLMEPIDLGGYDGYEVDGLHKSAADAIRTERAMYLAWRKRAEEAEAELLKLKAKP